MKLIMENWRKYLTEQAEDVNTVKAVTKKVEKFINTPTVQKEIAKNLIDVMNLSPPKPKSTGGPNSQQYMEPSDIVGDTTLKHDFKLKNIKKIVNKKLFNQKLNLSDIAGNIPGIPQEMKDLNIKAELDFKDIRKPSTGVLKIDIPIGDGTIFTANLPTKLKKLDKGEIQFIMPTKYGSLAMSSDTNFKRFSAGLSGEF